jgi:hypothetical protein
MASKAAQKRTTGQSNARSAMIWGTLALCSILAVCAMIALRFGSTTDTFMVARVSTTPPPARPVVQKPQGASEFEVARLNDAVRTLASERDRLAARVETLEQSVGDITASISTVKKPEPAPAETPKLKTPEIAAAPEVAAPAPPPAPMPVPMAAAAAPEPAPMQQQMTPPPSPVAQAPAPAPKLPFLSAATPPSMMSPQDKKPEVAEQKEAVPAHTGSMARNDRPARIAKNVKSSTMQRRPIKTVKTTPTPTAPLITQPRPATTAAKGPTTQVAQVMQQGQSQPEITGSVTKTEFGIDLGGETSLDALRARWTTIKGNHGAALNGLYPVVRVREGSRPGTVELHLIAGPVPNANTAAKVCANLQKTGTPCQTSEFDGQKLSIR